MPIAEILPAILFVASSGVLFSERFRRSRALVICAGGIALVSTYFLTVQIVDQVVAQRVGAASAQNATVAAREGISCVTRDTSLYASPDLQAPIVAQVAIHRVVQVLNSADGWHRVNVMEETQAPGLNGAIIGPTLRRGVEGYLRGDVLRSVSPQPRVIAGEVRASVFGAITAHSLTTSICGEAG